MIRFTTPTHVHKVKGIDLTGCDVYVSYEQGLTSVDIKAQDLSYDGEDTTVTVPLTQLQTSKFRVGKVTVQINWVHSDGKRNAVGTKEMEISRNLMQKVVKYGD